MKMNSEKLPPEFAITNANVWNWNGVSKAHDVFVSDGVITAVVPTGTRPLPPKFLDLRGAVLLPSGVDVQVHLRVPGQPEKETAFTGLRAALRGGVGAILTMPNTKPVIDSPQIVARARGELAAAESETGVKVCLSAAMTLGQLGATPVDARALKRAGVSAFTDDGKGVERDEVMRAVFQANEGTGLPLLQHAEVPGHGCALAAGPVQERLHLPAYPSEAEWKMVARDLALLKEFPNQRYHVLHVSSAKTVELITQAREEGLKATGETSPHHLLFTSQDISADDTSFKMNPPLRSPEDRAELRRALSDGRLAFAATDHAPHEAAAKGSDFAKSAFGTTGLEALLRVLLKLRNEGVLTEARLVQVFSTAPAQFLGIEEEFGRITVGQPLRAIWINPDAPERPLVVEELESLSKNSCFVGVPLPGHVHGHFNSKGFFSF